MPTGSPIFKLSSSDWLSIAKGAAIAGVGAAGVYGLSHVIPAIDSNAVGGAALAAVLAVVLNFARKLLTDTQQI